MGDLRREELDFYRRNGYLLRKKALFSKEKFERLHRIFEEHLKQKGEKRGDELDTPHFHDSRLLEFLLDDHVLDIVESIIGPDIALFSSHFISKEPYEGRATPWHEDSGYWRQRFDRYDNIVTIWLALDPATKENGCMRVIPGSHLIEEDAANYVPVDKASNTFGSEISNVDESKAVYFELQPNEYSLHDSRIVHGARENTSSQRRCGYTMRYFSTKTRLKPDQNQGFNIWLARGRDFAGNTYVNG